MELGLLPSAIIAFVESALDYFDLLEAKTLAEKELERTARTGISSLNLIGLTCSRVPFHHCRIVYHPGAMVIV